MHVAGLVISSLSRHKGDGRFKVKHIDLRLSIRKKCLQMKIGNIVCSINSKETVSNWDASMTTMVAQRYQTFVFFNFACYK